MGKEGKSKKGLNVFQWIIVSISSILVISVSIGVVQFNSLDNPPLVRSSEAVLFHVGAGATLGEIASSLQKEKLIQSELYLKFLSWMEGTGKAFRRGVFEIPPGATTREIHRILVKGETAKQRITIPEGLTARKIGNLLAEKKICNSEQFLEAVQNPELLAKYGVKSKSLDGLLFPDTYFFNYESTPEEVVETMVKAFFSTLDQIAADRGADESFWYNRLILASLVEREYRINEEAPLIASVFRNRLDNRMKLGSCATIEYIITEIRNKPHPKRIFIEDTEFPSPYNTYLNLGLPPSPICNPGKTALLAVFNPIETDYLYFVVKDPQKGSHVFSKNYADHNFARDTYISNYFSKS